MVNNDKLMTVQDVADFLQVQPLQVRTYINMGKLKAYKMGDSKKSEWRIWYTDLLNFLKVSR